MALMFPRLAQNFIRNGYFPTDEITLARILTALTPSSQPMRIIDPCAGEGVAIAEVAHQLGESCQSYAVEYDPDRAFHAAILVDHCLHGDIMETIISRQSFSLLFLNPPYGDLVKDSLGRYAQKGRARLEKLFYQHTLSYLQYGGILVFILPYAVIDAELTGWLTCQLTDIRIFKAPEQQFKQAVLFGRRVRQHESDSDTVKIYQQRLLAISQDPSLLAELPEQWPHAPYEVPAANQAFRHFYRATLEPRQLSDEISRLRGLWPDCEAYLSASRQLPRQPARALSHWHLALALAAGAITGVVTSPDGQTLVVKGDTHKIKQSRVEYTETEEGQILETRILTDRFVPAISAWDMTPYSPTFAELLSIL